MNARTFRASTMPEALAKVHAELGPEALVLASHKVLSAPAWQVWRGPEIEVLALPPNAAVDQGGTMSTESPNIPEPAPPSPTTWPEPLARTHRQLVADGVDENLATQIASGAAEMLGPRALRDFQRLREHLARDLAARLPVGEYLPRKGEQRIIVLVGSSGVGKTATTAKLAGYAHYTLGRRVAVITLDTFRVGALAQIQTFADILHVPLTVAYTPADLTAAVADYREMDLIVIDTPGRNPRRTAELVELAALLTPLPLSRRTFLVASATAKSSDLAEAASAFRGLELNGLMFTKMDETVTFGNLYTLACVTTLPASYFCFGPHVLHDIEPASPERLVDLMLELENEYV